MADDQWRVESKQQEVNYDSSFVFSLAPSVSLPALDLSSPYDCHLDATVL